MKELGYLFAALVIAGWVGALLFMPTDGVDEVTVPYAAASSVLLIGALGSWVSAVYVWSKVPREGRSHVVALVFLVLFGFFWAHFYLLASLRLLPREKSPRT